MDASAILRMILVLAVLGAIVYYGSRLAGATAAKL
jgi:hypothetical protein